MTAALLGLGSSLGNRRTYLRLALSMLNSGSTEVLKVSRVYQSLPIGPSVGMYMNACALIETSLDPWGLLRQCKDIEMRLGRENSMRWGDRTVDVDILLFGDLEIVHDDLIIPHSQLLNRSFALYPAQEVSPDFVHSKADKCLRDMHLTHEWPCWPVGVLSLAMQERMRYR